MKRFFGFFALLLAVAMSMSLFSGCSKKDAGNESKGNDTVQTKPTESKKVVTISWVPQNDAPVDANSPVIQELEKKFNVKFDFIYMDRSKSVELLNMRITSGDIPDVFYLNEDRFRSFIDQGILAQIPEDMVKKTAPRLYDLVKKNGGGDVAWEFPKDNGKLYGLPMLSPDGRYHYVPLWRDDWLKNVGITKIPETLQEAEDAFYKFVKDDPDKNNANDTYALSDKGMSVIFGAYGGIPYLSKGGGGSFTWSLKDNNIVATAVMPEMKEALTLLNKWYKDGLIDPEFISEENKGQYWGNSVTFWNGKIGFTCPGQYYHVNTPYSKNDKGSNNYQNFKKLQGEAATYANGKPLTGPAGKSGTESWGSYGGNYVVISKNVASDTNKMDKILAINEMVSGDFDTFVLTRYGIKDTTFAIEDGNYTYIGDALTIENRAKLGLSTSGIGYLNSINFEFYSKTQPNLYNYADKVGNTGNGYRNIVWGGLPSYPQYKAVIEKKIKEAYVLFVTGDRNLGEFDKFVEELNKAGLEQLTKEANDWYKQKYKK